MYNKFEKDIINLTLNSGGYKLQDFSNIINGETIWTLQRNTESLDEIVVFTPINFYTEVKNGIDIYIKENYVGNKGISLEFIVFKKKTDIASRSFDTYVNNAFVKNTSLVVIDEGELQIVYGEGSSNSAKIAELYIQRERRIAENKGFFKAPVTNILIIVNVIIYIYIATTSNQFFNIDAQTLVSYGAKYNPLINSGQYYRLFTAMFLHAGILHIALNMYALKVFGDLMERAFGSARFTIIYIAAGLVGNVASYAFSNDIAVGASGAIFGLLGAALVFGIRRRDKIGKSFYISVFQVIAVNLIIGLSISNIDNFAHLGGLVGGLITTYAVEVTKKQ